MALPGFLYLNLADGLTATGDSSDTVSGLGWSQLNDPQPRHRARVDDVTAILIWDLASAQAVDVAALISTSLISTSSVRLRASTSDPTCLTGVLYDSGVLPGPTESKFNGNVIVCLDETTARYWRWDITSIVGPIDIGLAPIGLLWRPEIGFSFGAQEGRRDLSLRDENVDTGAEFAISLPRKRIKQLTFSQLSSDEIRDNILEIDRLIGMSGDLLFVEDSDETQLHLARDSIWGSYRPGPEVLGQLSQINDVWARSFRLVERL